MIANALNRVRWVCLLLLSTTLTHPPPLCPTVTRAVGLQLVSLSVDEPSPATQQVTLSNVAGGTFTLRVMANAVGGTIDAETAEISFSAVAADVKTALEALDSGALGTVQVTRTTGTIIPLQHASPGCQLQ